LNLSSFDTLTARQTHDLSARLQQLGDHVLTELAAGADDTHPATRCRGGSMQLLCHRSDAGD
jgi:hypothetical protein